MSRSAPYILMTFMTMGFFITGITSCNRQEQVPVNTTAVEYNIPSDTIVNYFPPADTQKHSAEDNNNALYWRKNQITLFME